MMEIGSSMQFGNAPGALMLLALGMGYIVFYLANKENKPLRLLGSVIGVFIIIVSGSLLLANILICALGYPGTCPLSKKYLSYRYQKCLMLPDKAAAPEKGAPAVSKEIK